MSAAEIFEAAKERIDQLVSKPRGRRGHYRKFDDQTRLAVAKSCLEVGPSETSRRFNISESTVRCMKKVYLRLQAQNPGQEPTSLPCSQRGRPCLIGDFDKKVCSFKYVTEKVKIGCMSFVKNPILSNFIGKTFFLQFNILVSNYSEGCYF